MAHRAVPIYFGRISGAKNALSLVPSHGERTRSSIRVIELHQFLGPFRYILKRISRFDEVRRAQKLVLSPFGTMKAIFAH